MHDDNCWGRSFALTGIRAPLLPKTEENREVPVLRAIFLCSFYHAVSLDYETVLTLK